MAFKTIKCPSCGAQISVRVPDKLKSGNSGKAASAGVGAGIVGVAAEFSIEFPGPLTVALVAWIAGLFCAVFLPRLIEVFGNRD